MTFEAPQDAARKSHLEAQIPSFIEPVRGSALHIHEGRSTILNALPIRRAHPHFVENLNALGATVEWLAGD